MRHNRKIIYDLALPPVPDVVSQRMKETLSKIVTDEKKSNIRECGEQSKGKDTLRISSPLCSQSEMLYAYKTDSWENIFGSEDDTLADFIADLYQRGIICEGDLIEAYLQIKSMLKIQ